MEHREVLIVGAGPIGLEVAWNLQSCDIDALVYTIHFHAENKLQNSYLVSNELLAIIRRFGVCVSHI